MRRLIHAIAAVLWLGAASYPALAGAQERNVIVVQGAGSVSRQPDRAVLGVTAITSNDEAQAATAQNNAVYSAVVSRMRSLHIGEASIKTTSYDVTFVPKADAAASYKPPRTGFVVTRRLQIVIDDLSEVGRAVDAAVAAGVPQIDGVTFGLRDERAAYDEALAAAVNDAQAQATALARAAHRTLGAVQSIDATQTTIAPQGVLMRVAAAPAQTEIPPSAVEVRANVKVRYALGP